MPPLFAQLNASLSAKVVTAIAAIIMALAVLSATGLVLLVWPTFVEIQRNDATQNGARVQGAIAGLLDELDRTAQDWAAWDDTYAFAADRNEAYAASNLEWDPTLGNQLVGLYAVDGSVISADANDLSTGAPLDLGPLGTGLPPDSPLIAHQSTDSSVRALASTPAGLMLIASRPIIRSSGEGPVRGALIMGRLFDAEQIAMLRATTRVNFEVARADDAALTPAFRAAAAALAGGDAFHVVNSDRGMMDVYALLPVLDGTAPIILRAEAPKDVMAAGWKTLALAAAFVLLIGMAVSAAAWFALRRLVVAPVKMLTRHVLALARSGDLRQRFALPRTDEIGILAREFDAATAKLDDARGKLLEQSYYSGMAEMASGVIHNVRNAMNPIAVSLWRMSEEIRAIPIVNVEKALAELRIGNPSAERREKLFQFLTLTMQETADQQRSMADSLGRVAEQNGHIEQILDDHTAISYGKRALESVDLAAVVDEAVRSVTVDAAVPAKVVVDASLRALPATSSHRIVLAQILGNVLTNAIDSVVAARSVPGRVEISGKVETVEGRAMVHLVISDNGLGISEEQMATLFVRGYSTKERKGGGLGLHWCANSMAGFAGRIYAESAGSGKGAAIHLLLPAADAEDKQAA